MSHHACNARFWGGFFDNEFTLDRRARGYLRFNWKRKRLLTLVARVSSGLGVEDAPPGPDRILASFMENTMNYNEGQKPTIIIERDRSTDYWRNPVYPWRYSYWKPRYYYWPRSSWWSVWSRIKLVAMTVIATLVVVVEVLRLFQMMGAF